jgi:hypothetical protein
MIPLRAIVIAGTEQSRIAAQSAPRKNEISHRAELALATAAGRCAAAASAHRRTTGKHQDEDASPWTTAQLTRSSCMAFALTPPVQQRTTRPDHRIYRDPHGGDWITCRLIDDDALATLAAQSGQIEIRQALGGGWVPNTSIDHLVQGLRALSWIDDNTTPEVDRLRREMQRRIVDARARIRIRYGRHVLAGITQRMTEGRRQKILVLVLVRKFIRSCEWQLGTDTMEGGLPASTFRNPSSLAR